jgi:hypothetical protein
MLPFQGQTLQRLAYFSSIPYPKAEIYVIMFSKYYVHQIDDATSPVEIEVVLIGRICAAAPKVPLRQYPNGLRAHIVEARSPLL